MLALAAAAATLAASPARCPELASLVLDHAAVERAGIVGGGVCKVTGIARPVPGSQIRFELLLPPRERWSGRYYQIGNGGFAGAIHEPTLADGAARGDAIAGTDTGHSGNPFDASWARRHPIQVDDYGWRAIKATSDAARALLTRYYGKPARRHYAIGCSNGGRMALMAAARWPGEWDGVIAGSPANPWTDQLRSFVSMQRRLRADPANWIDPRLLPDIRAAALSECPEGSVRGGIALKPLLCGADFARLRCADGAHAHCLTGKQLSSLAAIVRAGYVPAAMVPSDWERWILAPPSAQSQLTFGRAADGSLTNARAALDVPAADLVRFGARGGKILSYFGWADAVIAPARGIGWYRAVARAAGRARAITGFYRLFMVPGMVHCQGGPGATSFGQSIEARPLVDDSLHDVRRALEAWVEQGRAPNVLIASGAAARKAQSLVPWHAGATLRLRHLGQGRSRAHGAGRAL